MLTNILMKNAARLFKDKKIRILIFEDNISDAELIRRQLSKSDLDYEAELASDKNSFTKSLDDFVPDIILADYAVPGFDGLEALNLVRQKSDIVPVIIVSGFIGEDVAIETLKMGATDYVLKDKLAKLVPAVKRALAEVRQMSEKKEAETRLHDAYETEHKIAQTLQKSLLTEEIPKIEGLDISYYYQSATKQAEVGGDFYDVFDVPKKCYGFVVGDVSGKGILAAAETSKIKYLLRDRAYSGMEPREALASVNESLLKQFDFTGTFTAITFGFYEPQSAILRLSNAGNPYPYLVKEDRFLEATGVPVAIRSAEKYESTEIKMQKGETLILCTDGLTESRRNSDFFGQEGIRDFAQKNKNLPLEDFIKGLVGQARNFSRDNLTDDILVLGLKKT